MAGKRGLSRSQEGLLAELEGIRDRYRLDVKQFIEFVRSRRLFIVDGLEQYAKWLDDGAAAGGILRRLSTGRSPRRKIASATPSGTATTLQTFTRGISSKTS